MKQHLTIHIYGKCGAPCPGNTEEDCLEYLSNYYIFLLVFETHVCQHYISPQLLRVLHLQKSSMIPVVFGGINYNDLFTGVASGMRSYLKGRNKILTLNQGNQHFKRSYSMMKDYNRIDIEDSNAFMIDALGQSPRALAHYLKHLVKDRSTERQPIGYLRNYLRWKHIYQLGIKEWPCLLCEKLRKEFFEKERHSTSRKNAVGKQYKSKTFELCTSWPKLDFGGGD